MKRIRYIFPLLALAFFACEPQMEEFKPEAGSANFSKYVAIGNSLTAGYADGALYRQGQLYSYPNLIATQLKLVGGGEFKQPLMLDELGMRVYTVATVDIPVDQKLVLGLTPDCKGTAGLGPVPAIGTHNAENQSSIAEQGPFQNMGVPGIRLIDLRRAGIGNVLTGGPFFNPYFSRFAKSSTTSTVLGDALEQNPSFFTLWIGSNDVLGYATKRNPLATITPANVFDNEMKEVVRQLTESGAKGVIANIPDITSIPFFTTIPPRALALTSPQQVDALNAAYAWNPDINFSLGANRLVVADPTAIGGMRQIKTTELVLLTLPLDSVKCAGWGSFKPVPQTFYLSEAEITNIHNAIQAFNASISTAANQYGLAVVDVNKMLSVAFTGLIFDGLKFNTEFVSGGLFSLDGVHLTPRGNAIVANLFIKTINEKYNAKIPFLNVGDYPGVIFP